jgi:hypothetical protein
MPDLACFVVPVLLAPDWVPLRPAVDLAFVPVDFADGAFA